MKKRFGTEYGGFYLPDIIENYLNKDSIIYAIGVGEDISFDVVLANCTGAKVHMYDPTPRSIDHVDLIKESFVNGTKVKHDKRFGGGDVDYVELLFRHRCDPRQLVFDSKAVTGDSALTHARFFTPKNKEHVSCSLLENANYFDTSSYYDVECTTLFQEMKHHGHDRIDLLKLDVEGVECDILKDLFDHKVYPTIICVEFDLFRYDPGNEKVRNLVTEIERLGYKLFHRSGLDFTFIYCNN